MRDADFLRAYGAAVRSYRLGAASAERVLNAVLRRLGFPPLQSGKASGADRAADRRIGT